MIDHLDQAPQIGMALNATQRLHYFCNVCLGREDGIDVPLSPLVEQRLNKILGLTASDFVECIREIESHHPCYVPRHKLV